MSADNYYLKEHIKRHINFYTSPEVIDRGKKLYETDKVFFDEYIEKTDSWKFTVKGSQKYQVLIKGVNNKDIQTSCTCPFDWGSICKHTVAALLFVTDNLGEQYALQYQKQPPAILPVSNRTGEKFGYEIPDYQHIDIDFIKRNTSPRALNQLMYYSNFKLYNSVEITNETISFISGVADANVTFYKEDGKVFITSPRAATSSKLTPDEAHCLKVIANSPMPHILDEIFSGRILAKEKEKLARFGLPEDTSFNEYFTYIFTEQDGLMFFPSKKGVGLLPVIEDSNNPIIHLLEELNNDDLFLTELPGKKEKRELGFVLKKGFRFYSSYEGGYVDYYEDEGNERYEIVAIVGKTRKNDPLQLSTHIKEYDEGMDDRFIIDKTDNSKKLLRLIDEIDDNFGSDFQLMKKAFGYLQNEKFVYGLAAGADKIRKKDLMDITLSPEPADIVFEVSKKKEFLSLDLKIKLGDELKKRKVFHSKPQDNYIFTSGTTYHFARSEKVAQMIAEFPEQVKMV
ncbi:MAG TPA: hypothetical protein ENN90_07810, partial [Mariniphaga anaerophila]|nr:hypothetical protein [Mariniphaga anaerophila]